MLYLFDSIETLDMDYLLQCLPLLNEHKYNKIISIPDENEQLRSAVAYMILRYGLWENFGINKHIEFSYNKNGKPYLCDYPGIYFSVSHCHNVIGCLISTTEVGLSLLDEAPVVWLPVAKKILTDEEYKTLTENMKYPESYFTLCSVVKMSKVKQKGLPFTDLFNELPQDDVDTHFFADLEQRYFGAIAGMPNTVVKHIYSHGINENGSPWFDLELTHKGTDCECYER